MVTRVLSSDNVLSDIAAHQSSPQCAHSSVIHGSAVDSRVTVGVTIVGMKLDQLPGALGV